MYLLDMGRHYMNALSPLSPCRISQELFALQLPYRKLFQRRGVDCGVGLIRNHHDPLIGREATHFNRGCQPGDAIADNDNICPVEIRLTIQTANATTVSSFAQAVCKELLAILLSYGLHYSILLTCCHVRPY